jgi:hypothetical protein
MLLDKLRKELYEKFNFDLDEELLRIKKSKPLKFALTSSFIDSLSTGIHMKLYEGAVDKEANLGTKYLVLIYGIEKGLIIYHFLCYLPAILGLYFLSRLVDSAKKRTKGTHTYEKLSMYTTGLYSLTGAYSWLKEYELNTPNNVINTLLYLPFFVPYIFTAYYFYRICREISKDVENSLKIEANSNKKTPTDEE